MKTIPMNGKEFQSPQESVGSSSSNSQSSSNGFILESVPKKSRTMPDEDPNCLRNRWVRVEFTINLINHILIGFITIYMSWTCLRLSLQKTALHAWLCTIGFVFLMSEGVMTHYNGNSVMFSYTRKTKTTVHWVFQALGGSLGIAGGIVKMAEKEVHFTTIHGKLGFSAMILCAVSMISGLSALYSQTLKRILQPLLNKTIHNLLGISAFVLAMAAQYYGYDTGFFRRKVEDDFRYMIGVITLLSLVLSCWGPLRALVKKCVTIMQNF